ncbi:unnamed protein product [Coccothraustes coccothraustes]
MDSHSHWFKKYPMKLTWPLPVGKEPAWSSSWCHTSCAFKPPCSPIKFPPDEPRAPSSDTCMPFVQSMPACGPGTFQREQLNAATSFIDPSTMYGSDDALARSLRNLSSQLGLMALNPPFWDAGLELLPFENTAHSVCVLTNRSANICCFKAVRIVIAINQIITYRDYLPLLLAEETSKWIPLYGDYNEKVDPRASNVFSLAFRFGHTLVQPYVSRLNESFPALCSSSHVPLHLTFCAPWRIIMEGSIDPLIGGMVVCSSHRVCYGPVENNGLEIRKC